MSKKSVIELSLLLIIILISLMIFNFYFKEGEKNEINSTAIKESDSKPLLDDETASVIKNINYNFLDENNNNYKIIAEFGKIDVDQPDVIKMTNVTAYAYLENTEPIKIVSKYASYNKKTHLTNFYRDVRLNYLNHETKSQNLDLLLKKNLIHMYNELIYINGNIELLADKLLFDLKTKNTKIYMDHFSKEVKVKRN
tara:strand:- start:882 stop:1472 length:591 start_codon:yes stop_codon:yes gene_type:complete